MQQHLRVDGDIFYTDKKRCVFINIRIRVDGALELMLDRTVLAWVAGNEVIVTIANTNIPLSLSWFLLPFLASLCFPASA